jgi:hypothetical protein
MGAAGSSGGPLVSHTTSLENIAERLDSYARRYEHAKDSRCVFAFAYAGVTRRIGEELPQLQLADPEWIVALAEVFAGRFFRALDGQDAGAGGEVVPAWKVVFDTIRPTRTSVLEDFLLPCMVHIVHDLPLTLCDVRLADDHGRSHIHDFHAINNVLADSIVEIQGAIWRRYSPGTRWLDRFGKYYGQLLTSYGIHMARGLAWYNANRLLDPDSEEQARQAIQRSPAIFVNEVMHPPVWSVRIVLRLGRWIVGWFRVWPAAR